MTLWLPAWSVEEAVEQVREGFAERFGGEPVGVWAAPGRVNIIGEHTDYNAGLCLPMALAHATYAAIRPRGDQLISLVSAQMNEHWKMQLADIAPGKTRGWGAYAGGVAWSMNQAGIPVPGFEAYMTSYVPTGAGLSSSAALECAFGVAIDELTGSGLVKTAEGQAKLVQLCVRAENEIAGAPTGGLDQSASIRSLENHLLLLDFASGDAEPVPFNLEAAGLELLIIDTRAHHTLTDGQYGSRRDDCEKAASLLGLNTLREIDELAAALARLAEPTLIKRVRHVFTENQRTAQTVELLRAGKTREIGGLLDESHASLRDDYQVSCAELDLAVDTPKAMGALGARMTGGGFGGSAIALIPAGTSETVAEAVADAFAKAGFTPPAFLFSPPAPGARRVA